MNKNNLPYFNIQNNSEYRHLYKFLRQKFIPFLRQKHPKHFLITQNRRHYLEFIKQTSVKHPYFLSFDIKKFFPSINHQILLEEIENNYRFISGKTLSRRFGSILKKDLPEFLQHAPAQNTGLPLGSGLSHILAGIYLLNLDLSLPFPFLRFCDDYIVFFKNKNQAEKILKKIIEPEIHRLDLSLNIKKLGSGKFNKDKVTFLGFEFYAGYIKISQDKIDNFRRKIIKTTHLTKHKPYPAIIKQLNNQILGFGHYYKHANAKQEFEKLDSFIRMRLRRYLARHKDSREKQVNLSLSNSSLQSLGLKSLTEIHQKYRRKNKAKFGKRKKKEPKTCHKTNPPKYLPPEQNSLHIRQKAMFNQLSRLTGLVEKMDKKLAKIEKELVKRKKR